MNAKKRARKSFLVLMKKHPFDKITIDMIVEEADISRTTFYRYYADKYELASDTYVSILDTILAKENGSNWQQLLEEVLTLYSKNKDVYQKLLQVKGYNSFYDFLYGYTERFYREKYLEGSGDCQLDVEKKVRLDCLCKGQIGILVSWLQRDCKEPDDPRVFAKIMYELIPEEFRLYI